MGVFDKNQKPIPACRMGAFKICLSSVIYFAKRQIATSLHADIIRMPIDMAII